MTEGALSDRLDQTIDTILKRGDATAALSDAALAPLARLAADLRHYPSPEFTARLRAHLKRRTVMSSATLASSDIRDGFTTITPYVRVREAGLADFLARVFGAEETHSARGSAGGMHREVRVGDSMIMIGEDAAAGMIPPRPTAFHVYVPDVDAAFERAIAAGATSLGAPADRPYGERSGFVRDTFGNHWYIATHLGGSSVPAGLRTVTPFLHVSGAAAYIEFLKRAFGAVEEGRVGAEGHIRHGQVRIGNAALELGDADGEATPMPGAFYLYVDDADQWYERAIAAGAASLWPPKDQVYGDRTAGVEDTMGNQWFIARPSPA
jgi:PhnB protein